MLSNDRDNKARPASSHQPAQSSLFADTTFAQALRQVQRRVLNHEPTHDVLASASAPDQAPSHVSAQLMHRWRHARATDDIELIIRDLLLPLAPGAFAVGVLAGNARGKLNFARTWSDVPDAAWPEFESDPAALQELLHAIIAAPVPLCWSHAKRDGAPIAMLLRRMNWQWLAAMALRSESSAGTLAIVAGTDTEPPREAYWSLLAQLALEAHVKHFELRHLGAAPGARAPGPFDIFTERQHAVFELFARGLPAADVAEQLEISERRVWQHARAGADAVQLPLRAAVAHYAREKHGDAV